MSNEAPTFSIPLRRMTQAELDAFLEKAADILRGNVDHSEFRGYVFALLFFKRISDLFEEAVRKLAKQVGEELANDPAMQKKSLPFVVPPDSTWEAVTGGTAENRITSLQLGQSLNDAIRSGFLRDDLLEAVIVLPSGIFYGNNVPACLAIINKRKPNARKDRVLMIWASRHYQHANPQSFLRRADCLRILLPWRAFGDAAIP